VFAIEARGVTAGYGTHRVLEDVSFGAAAGEIVALLGPNGAGKSTLLRVLAGTLEPSAGSVEVFGRALGERSRRELAQVLAVVPQDSDVAFGFDVRQVVMMGRAPHQSGLLLPTEQDLAAVDAALARCDLTELAARRVSELSGGERRRVTIARALAQAPSILLLDEPAAHLDVRHAVSVYELVRREVSEREVASVAVVHDLAAAARWADRVVLLASGRVRAAGTPAEVLTAELLGEVFGVPIRVGVDPEGDRYFIPARLAK
jgi:ABC-type cobalamin/Fe3+-siderophores transport system ATPase subunit